MQKKEKYESKLKGDSKSKIIPKEEEEEEEEEGEVPSFGYR